MKYQSANTDCFWYFNESYKYILSKTSEKNIEKKEKEIKSLIEENIINFKISASFTRGEGINPKTKAYIYKYDGVTWSLE